MKMEYMEKLNRKEIIKNNKVRRKKRIFKKKHRWEMINYKIKQLEELHNSISKSMINGKKSVG